jgi:hypothetical protein
MFNQDELQAALRAFRNGMDMDMLQIRVNGVWQDIWTVTPSSIDSMEKVARQFSRMRLDTLRHIRRAYISNTSGERQHVMIATELPDREQIILRLDDGKMVQAARTLIDEALLTLEECLRPQTPQV